MYGNVITLFSFFRCLDTSRVMISNCYSLDVTKPINVLIVLNMYITYLFVYLEMRKMFWLKDQQICNTKSRLARHRFSQKTNKRFFFFVLFLFFFALQSGIEVSPSKERCAMCEFLGQLSSSYVVNLMIF